MNQTQIESMRLALGALEGLINRTSAQSIYSFMETERRIAISACVGLREALAEQPAPMIRGDIRDGLVDDEPAQRTWVGLTRAERFEIEKAMSKYYDYQHECKTVCLPEFARAIEAKLKEKNA